MVRVSTVMSYDEVPADFRQHVDRVLRNEWMGEECDERVWGITPFGQHFVFVTTKVVWYAVRLIVDEEHRDLELSRFRSAHSSDILYKDQFLSLEDAQAFIRQRHAELEDGNFGPGVPHRVRKVPEAALLNPDDYIKPGDHIQRRLEATIPFGNHEGVYLGNGRVAHIHNEHTAAGVNVLIGKQEAYARIETLGYFASKQEIRIVVHCLRRRTREDICADAERLCASQFRRGEYNLFQQNCQHFASYCVLGTEWMSDKDELIEKGIFWGALAAIAGAGVYAWWTRNDDDRERRGVALGSTHNR